ncbi:MAG: phasin family protein [Mangrovicoccus sp.]
MTEKSMGATPMDMAVLGAWAGLQDSAATTMSMAMNIWATTAGEMMQNYAGFMARRWQADLELWQDMARCTTPQELMELQRKFAERAWASYRDETERLQELAGNGACAMACQARGGDSRTERVASLAA